MSITWQAEPLVSRQRLCCIPKEKAALLSGRGLGDHHAK